MATVSPLQIVPFIICIGMARWVFGVSFNKILAALEYYESHKYWKRAITVYYNLAIEIGTHNTVMYKLAFCITEFNKISRVPIVPRSTDTRYLAVTNALLPDDVKGYFSHLLSTAEAISTSTVIDAVEHPREPKIVTEAEAETENRKRTRPAESSSAAAAAAAAADSNAANGHKRPRNI
jgi:hypothetical protein